MSATQTLTRQEAIDLLEARRPGASRFLRGGFSKTDTAKIMGISRRRVDQLEERALRKLFKEAVKEGLEELLNELAEEAA